MESVPPSVGSWVMAIDFLDFIATLGINVDVENPKRFLFGNYDLRLQEGR